MMDSDPLKVLIVEDNFMVSEMIRGRLLEGGYEVAGQAGTGLEALQMAQSLHPDVILMDIEMPEMDGIEATQKIYETCPTPIVMLTAYETPELVNKASQAGAGAYVVKLPKSNEIERAITIATARFKDMMELRRLNAELDAFAHTAAHDLQSPLGLVTAYAELLREELRLTDEQQKYFSALIRNAHKMNSVIKELLLLSEMRKTEVKLEPVNMGRIVAEAQQRLSVMIQEYNAKIILPEHWPQAMGYAPWVEEVWANYISNGIKYGGDPPRLHLGATKRSDGFIRFWIRDNGPGLTPEEQAKLFAPLTRLHQTQATGYGLGLSIVKRIIDKLGGEVGLEKGEGAGSIFYFSLPARSAM